MVYECSLKVSINWFENVNGHLTMTRLAGKLTPDDKVEVAIRTRIIPSLKAPEIQ